MSYTSSPRPSFDNPTQIPYETVTRHLWGDQVSGEVADWIYVSSAKIHQLVFGLPPGGRFRHSEDYRTIFAGDEVYYVLSGILALNNPETGEVQRALPGEAIFFRRDTWHHGYNVSTEPLRVLEFFAPPPMQGTSSAYSRTKPILQAIKSTQDEWLGRWPMQRFEREAKITMRMVRDADFLWRLEGEEDRVLVGILIATEHLTVTKVELRPGQHSVVQRHGGDEGLYLLEGNLNVRVPQNDGQKWFELKPGDGFYVPEDALHQYYNISDKPVRFICGVAPNYLIAQNK